MLYMFLKRDLCDDRTKNIVVEKYIEAVCKQYLVII